MMDIDIKKNTDFFLENINVYSRDSSFDFCYNYFYKFYKNDNLNAISNKENLQMSCLQLGFYLASWGMYRGSTHIVKRSVKYLDRLIKYISTCNPILWKIDVNNYLENDNLNILLECYEDIKDCLKEDKYIPSNTLITKVMLGVWANIPAFDDNFCKSFKMSKINKSNLKKLNEHYIIYTEIYDKYKIFTFNFYDAEKTQNRYKFAKLIDMYGFTDGSKKNNLK
jgi:hypothetical protein